MLKDKIVVITGASSGIGAALAKAVGMEGAKVVLAARREKKLQAIAQEIGATGGTALAVSCDVSRKERAEELIERSIREFGTIDVLVNNAGRGHFAAVEDTTDDVIREMFAVNVFSLWFTTRPALRRMKAQGSGHIINVASMAGKLGYPYNSAYVAAKHACVGFTLALRQELAETGIHASVVCPAGVKTEWASATEGGPLVSFFSESGPSIKRIARERGIELPPVEGVKTAEEIAQRIVECMHHPVAEVYTHRGSHEFAMLAARDRENAEHHQLPVVLGEREVYERMKKTSGQDAMK